LKAKTPVAVFVYNRPEHARNTLASLEACQRLEECDIFIFSDGPRISEHENGVSQVRSIVRVWASAHKAQLVEQSENIGLARSILDGVSRLCEEYGRVIVVEDDLILHPAFIHFMLSSLDQYESEEGIAQISGYMYPIEKKSGLRSFFLPFTSTWGWATWQHIWKNVDWSAAGSLEMLENSNTNRLFDLNGSYPHTQMLRDKLKNKNQSWGILFYWWVFSQNLLVLHPSTTLVINTGMDGSGYHTPIYPEHSYPLDNLAENQKHLTIDLSTPILVKADWEKFNINSSIEFPEALVVNQKAYRAICSFLLHLNPNIYQKVASRIKRILNYFFRKYI